MKLFAKSPDGGSTSGVTAYTVIECKPLFSIVLLRFGNGTREAYHSHAFNAVTLWLAGRVREHRFGAGTREYSAGQWKLTRRSICHRVESLGTSWALSFRGPWRNTWDEVRNGRRVTLTHGRQVVSDQP